MMNQKLYILRMIAEKLNDLNIVWNIGASCMLCLRGIVNDFDDIDIMVQEKDAIQVKDVLENMGNLQPKKMTDQYVTTHFYEFNIQGVDVDLMAGFKVKNEDDIHEFSLDSKNVDGYYDLDGINIPLASVDDWLVYYKAMRRHDKVDIIETYVNRKER